MHCAVFFCMIMVLHSLFVSSSPFSADHRFLPSKESQASRDGLPSRPKSVGSGSVSSSSSSSGRGSQSPVGYVCRPTRRAASGGLVGYMAPPGGLEEDDLDHGGGIQNLLRECALIVTMLPNTPGSTPKGGKHGSTISTLL